MRTILSLLSILLLSNSASAIIGGQKLTDKDALADSIVAVWDSEQEFLCTGTLISESIVITAAHCMISHPSKLRIIFGTDAFLTLNAREIDVQQEYVRKVISGRIHEGYNFDESKQPMNDQNDLAILQFAGPMPSGYRALPVLRDVTKVTPGLPTVVAGYGVTKVSVIQLDLKTYNPKKLEMGLKSGQIRCDETKTDCISVITEGFSDLFATTVIVKSLSKFEFRTDESRGRASCSGDSGGPAFMVQDGKYQLFGLVSRGKVECNSEGVFTNITRYLPWIQETVLKFENNPAVKLLRRNSRLR